MAVPLQSRAGGGSPTKRNPTSREEKEIDNRHLAFLEALPAELIFFFNNKDTADFPA
jgi:hypothetical protein